MLAPAPDEDLFLVPASIPGRLEQLHERCNWNIAAVQRLDFSANELAEIDRFAVESGVDLWAEPRKAADEG